MTNEDAANILRLMASGIELKNHTEHWISSFEKAYEMAIKVLEERPQGEWLEMKRKIDNRHSVFIFKCPFCGYIEKCKANFCGNCGAEMKMRTTAD